MFKLHSKSDKHRIPGPLLDPNVSAVLSALKRLDATAKRPPALMTISAACEYLGGVKTDFVRDMIANSEVKYIQRADRGKILIPVSELDRWIERHSSYAGTPPALNG